jgi:Tfp pilus assembly protein PilN
LDRSRQRLADQEQRANIVLELEDRAARMTQHLDKASEMIELHEQLSFPFDLSRLLSTIVNQLPESATIERLNLETQPQRAMRSASQRTGDERAPRRHSIGELSGFAASDDHIAELVARMESSRIFQSVTWDFSRSRVVRERPAREFRVSFQINLDQNYEIVEKRHQALGIKH